MPVSCEGFALSLAHALSTRHVNEVFDFEPESLSNFLSHLTDALTPIEVGLKDDEDDISLDDISDPRPELEG